MSEATCGSDTILHESVFLDRNCEVEVDWGTILLLVLGAAVAWLVVAHFMGNPSFGGKRAAILTWR